MISRADFQERDGNQLTPNALKMPNMDSLYAIGCSLVFLSSAPAEFAPAEFAPAEFAPAEFAAAEFAPAEFAPAEFAAAEVSE